MSLSGTFVKAFLAAYEYCEGLFSSEQWNELWAEPSSWSNFMLWKAVPPQSRSVLALTAENMQLKYWDREPFRTDGAFARTGYKTIGNIPHPIVAAIEHENDFNSFSQELTKLSYLRCPLKVGITYCLLSAIGNGNKPDARRDQIVEWICEIEGRMEVREDPQTEYSILLGVENRKRHLQWMSLAYTAGETARSGKWSILTA
jgi:hypothetical protein